METTVISLEKGSQVSRLEKADILEMTVKYLQHVQCQQQAVSAESPAAFLPLPTTPNTSTEPEVAARFSAGYTECAAEVIRYMESVTGMTEDMKSRLESHLVGRLHGPTTASTSSPPPQPPSTPSFSTDQVTNVSSCMDAKANQNHTASVKYEKSHDVAQSVKSTSPSEIVSPRHYQTALDLANMASSIVQQQQQQHQQHHHQQQQQQSQQQAHVQSSYSREDAFSISQNHTLCSNMAATPDTPPNTPPHMDNNMDMDTDCYYENDEDRYSYENITKISSNSNNNFEHCEQNKMIYNQSSSSPISNSSTSSLSSSSPSSSPGHDDGFITDSARKIRKSICSETVHNNPITASPFNATETKMPHFGNGNSQSSMNNVEGNLASKNHSQFDDCQKTNNHINTSPIDLIRRRLPLAAYATPLHIDIPDSRSPSTTPSPPHLLPSLTRENSRDQKNTTTTNIIENNLQNPHHYYRHANENIDNESLPTILYGVPSQAYVAPIPVPATNIGPHLHHPHPQQFQPSQPDATIMRMSQENSCNPDNRANNTKCHSETISSCLPGPQETATKKAGENIIQTPQLSRKNQGHHQTQGQPFPQIDTHHVSHTPSPPTLTREDLSIKPTQASQNQNPSLKHSTTTTQKYQYSLNDPRRHTHYLKTSPNEFVRSPTPYATDEIRKSPKPIIVDHKNTTDMRNSVCRDYDQLPEANDIHNNASTNRDFNKANLVDNNYTKITCNNRTVDIHHRNLAPIFTQPAQNEQDRAMYRHQQQIKQEQYIDNIMQTTQYYKSEAENKIAFQMTNSTQYTRNNDNVNIQYRQFSSPLNHHILSKPSHPSSNYHQLHHQRFYQTHSLGMRSAECERSTAAARNTMIRSGHFMNENGPVRIEKFQQYKNNNKTQTIASVAVAASRQNGSALLSPALGSVMTGHLPEVNSFSTLPHSCSRVVARQEVVESHESRTSHGYGDVTRMGHNRGNYTDHVVSHHITALDSISHGEQVWRPW